MADSPDTFDMKILKNSTCFRPRRAVGFDRAGGAIESNCPSGSKTCRIFQNFHVESDGTVRHFDGFRYRFHMSAIKSYIDFQTQTLSWRVVHADVAAVRTTAALRPLRPVGTASAPVSDSFRSTSSYSLKPAVLGNLTVSLLHTIVISLKLSYDHVMMPLPQFELLVVCRSVTHALPQKKTEGIGPKKFDLCPQPQKWLGRTDEIFRSHTAFSFNCGSVQSLL